MLRGDLRRQILTTLKTEKEISLLWRELLKTSSQDELSLMKMEEALIAAVETSGLVQVSIEYRSDREVRQGAEQAREQGLFFGKEFFTRVDKVFSLDNVFVPIPETSPADKFLHLLVKVECQRTIEALLMLVNAVHDDSVVRTYIIKLFTTITSLCKDAKDQFIKELLTQFYFEVFHTFKSVLEKGRLQLYETDFENFVFAWKGVFPDKEIMARYNEKVNIYISPENNRTVSPKLQLPDSPKSVIDAPKDKFDIFLEAANAFTFLEIPKVKELGTPQKIRQLVECLLQDKGSAYETFGHTAAMLEFLGFYKWIADNHISGYKLKQYDSWCSKNIMNKARGTAFKHYRLSVNVDASDTLNESHKYLGWKYKEIVEKEYNDILSS